MTVKGEHFVKIIDTVFKKRTSTIK